MRTAILDYRNLIPGLITLLLAGSAHGQSAVPEVDWQRPDTDFSRYSAFLIKPLDLSDVKVLKPDWEQENPEVWSIEDDALDEIQGIFKKTMAKALSGEDGYEIALVAGEGVLQLEVEFLSITPYVKPGTKSWNRDLGGSITTLGSGDVVISAELRDSVTGSLLVVVEGERQIGTEYKELSRLSHIENLKSTFRRWGHNVRAWMDAERAP